MSLSIFSSSNAARAILLVGFLLVGAEILMRPVVRTVASDANHIDSIPEIAGSLARSTGLKILFLGNSLVKYGVVPDVIRNGLGVVAPEGIEVALIHPDNAAVEDWYYILTQSFDTPESRPDLLVIPFDTERLADAAFVDMRQLAKISLDSSVLEEMWEFEAVSADARFQLLLAEISALYRHSEKERTTILGLFVPGYQQAETRLNETLRADSDTQLAALKYTRLSRLLTWLQSVSLQTVFVSVPRPMPAEVDPQAIRLIEEAGMVYLDGRIIEGLDADMYLDGYHLDERGAPRFSNFLVRELANILRAE